MESSGLNKCVESSAGRERSVRRHWSAMPWGGMWGNIRKPENSSTEITQGSSRAGLVRRGCGSLEGTRFPGHLYLLQTPEQKM